MNPQDARSMIEVSYLPPQLPPDRNYSGRYIAAGVILLVLAVFGGCITGLIPVGNVAQQKAAQQPVYPGLPATTQINGVTYPIQQPVVQPMAASALIMALAIYGFITVTCGWLGLASLMKHRYVRPLLLIFSTLGMITGGLSLLVAAVTLPAISDQMTRTSHGNSFAVVAAVIGAIIGAGLFVGLPALLFFLMRPEGVRETAEHFDIKPRWTDGLPLQTLGLVLTLAFFAATELLTLSSPVVPIFWFVLKGFTAGALILAHIAVLSWAAYLVYRRKGFGWTLGAWAVLVPTVIFLISTLTMPTQTYLDAVSDQPDLVDMLQGHATLFRLAWAALAAITLVITVVYLLRVRKYVEVRPAMPLE